MEGPGKGLILGISPSNWGQLLKPATVSSLCPAGELCQDLLSNSGQKIVNGSLVTERKLVRQK